MINLKCSPTVSRNAALLIGVSMTSVHSLAQTRGGYCFSFCAQAVTDKENSPSFHKRAIDVIHADKPQFRV